LLGTPVSLNMYTYANNDPLGFYDPDGHDPGWAHDRDPCNDAGYYKCAKVKAGKNAGKKILTGYGKRALDEIDRGIGVDTKRSCHLDGSSFAQECGEQGMSTVAPTPVGGELPYPQWPEPFDPFDGTRTTAEVRNYLLHRYSAAGKAFSLFEQTYAVDWALATNQEGRARESESRSAIAKLWFTHMERGYHPEAPYLTAMDNFALTVALPWSDVQSVTICGENLGHPIYCAGVTRLPTFSDSAVAMTVGNFILLDITDGAKGIQPDADGNWSASPELMAHELTHLYRSMQMAGVDSDGVDDRYWYLQYVLGDSAAEEDCAYQVGQGGEDGSHLVTC